MEKVYVMDNRGRETEAFKIRYFDYQEKQYFIYTLGEIDKDEYVKLYLKQLQNGEEQTITEEEWTQIRSMIQKIVKEIRNKNIISFKDLNMSGLNEIMENDTRVFKLKKDIVEQIIYEEDSVDAKDEPISVTEPKIEDDSFIENIEHSIKNTFAQEIETISTEVEDAKMKPIILGTLSNEYKEKCENLEKELKLRKEKCENLEKDLEEYKIIIYKLKEENTVLKKKLIEYHQRLEQVKKMTEGI